MRLEMYPSHMSIPFGLKMTKINDTKVLKEMREWCEKMFGWDDFNCNGYNFMFKTAHQRLLFIAQFGDVKHDWPLQ